MASVILFKFVNGVRPEVRPLLTASNCEAMLLPASALGISLDDVLSFRLLFDIANVCLTRGCRVEMWQASEGV